MTDTEQQPAIRVLGPATAEEVAAVVAVLAAAGGADEGAPERPVSRWASRAAALHAPAQHGPGAWRATLRH